MTVRTFAAAAGVALAVVIVVPEIVPMFVRLREASITVVPPTWYTPAPDVFMALEAVRVWETMTFPEYQTLAANTFDDICYFMVRL